MRRFILLAGHNQPSETYRRSAVTGATIGGLRVHGGPSPGLLTSFAWNLIVFPRKVKNDRDRLIYLLLSPAMSCRLSVPYYCLAITHNSETNCHYSI